MTGLRGRAALTFFRGGPGDDVMVFGGSNNGVGTFYGDDGFDSIIATATNTVIRLNGIQSVERIDAQSFTGVRIEGTAAADNLDFRGTALVGIGRIDAGDGNDTIGSSGGADMIDGGAGNDQVVYSQVRSLATIAARPAASPSPSVE